MAAAGFADNPAWVNRLLSANWPRLTARVPAELLPVEAESSSARRRKVTEFGCGHYGCVSPTSTPSVVFKVTSDPLEAHFVAAALSLKTFPDGIVRYDAVAQLDGEHRGRPVFAIWREEAHDIGVLFSHTWLAKLGDYDRRAVEEFKRRLELFKRWAGDLKATVDRATDRAKTVAEMHRFADAAWERVALDDVDQSRHLYVHAQKKPFPYMKGGQRAAMLRRGCEIIAEMMANEPGGYMVGQALEFYLEHGLLLADVHANNIGRVEEPDREGFVITDPGHAVPLDERFAAVRIEAV
jgi:hypothetical protein